MNQDNIPKDYAEPLGSDALGEPYHAHTDSPEDDVKLTIMEKIAVVIFVFTMGMMVYFVYPA